jgi:hypothetical protein
MSSKEVIRKLDVSPGPTKILEVDNDETIYPKYAGDSRRVAAQLRRRVGGTDDYRRCEWNGD